MPDRPTLTLCLIARDEEAFLGECLESVKGVATQIVVVDTGSTDRTREIALAAGARVVEHLWNDDFSAARNAALPHARGDWVLMLDADERLAPGAGRVLLDALRRPAFVLGLLPLHDATRLDASPAEILSGAARTGERVLLPRLMRRLPDLAWTGRLHENVGDWIVRHGRKATLIEADILHFGAIPEVRNARGKAERNRRLLELECATAPERVYPWAYLAAERERAGDGEGARSAEETGWQMLLAAIQRGEHPAAVPLIGRRGNALLARGDFDGVVGMVAQARTWGVDHPNLCWLLGSALLGLGRDPTIELRRALAWTTPCADEIFQGVRGWRSRMLLAQALLTVDPAEALQHADAATAEAPGPGARLLSADALIALGRHGEALARIEPLLASGTSDAWAVAAVAAAGVGDLESATLFDARVTGPIASWRAGPLAALRTELAFRRGVAVRGPGPWGVVAALVHGLPLDNPAPVPASVLQAAAQVLARQGDATGLAGLLGRRGQALLPDMLPVVLAALAEEGLDWTDDEDDFIFIGGAGRSGTTLFRAMLSAHANLWCGPERKLIPVFAEVSAGWARSLGPELAAAGVDSRGLDRAARAWIAEFLRAGAPDSRRLAEKTPHNLIHAGWLGQLFPAARFIHVIRDGRAVAESLVRQSWRDPQTGKLLPYCQDLSSAARYWASVVTESRRQCAMVPRRGLEVRYEQLIAEPRETMQMVLAFLGEPWDEQVLHHESAGVVLSARESSTQAVGRARSSANTEAWRSRLSEKEVATIEDVAGPVLRAFGY